MRAVVQRVTHARVSVGREETGAIGRGLLVLLAVAPDDGDSQARWLARKVCNLRIFPDGNGRMNLSLLDVSGQVLVVSQFTLYGNTRKGNRPSFVASAPPDVAEPLYQRFCSLVQAEGVQVRTGRFGAMMEVELLNDGPVTLIMDTP